MKFLAEITEVKAKKTVSLDIEYSVKLRTEDKEALKLGELPADTIVKISIETT